jgi:cycloartenol synthase
MWTLRTASDVGHPPTLNAYAGRQTWHYDPEGGTPAQRAAVDAARKAFTANRAAQPHSSDELLRLQAAAEAAARGDGPRPQPPPPGPDVEAAAPAAVKASLLAGASFYATLQRADGHWPGDYGGPMFLLPGLLITLHVTGALDDVLPPATHQPEAVRYLTNHQNADGGFGLHIEGHSTMFGTVLSYVSLRILRVAASDARCVAARAWIAARGGPTHVTSWGKFWLALLGVYGWEGVNPMPPEAWLLPRSKLTGVGWAHPSRMWCHCRMVYLPMSYVYGRRATAPPSPLVDALREELYEGNAPFHTIDWDATRNTCAKEDLYYPHPPIQNVLWWGMARAEPWLVGSRLRAAALREIVKHVAYEDENSRYVCIGPVNKVINMLVRYLDEGPDGPGYRAHLGRIADYLWVAEDGLKMQGYNGSQLWDTAFAVQALSVAGADVCAAVAPALAAAARYIEASQVVDDPPGPLSKWYRHISKGAWPFSSRDHGWPISDCSAEGVKAVLALDRLGTDCGGGLVSGARLEDAVNVILSYQNAGGGWATYENTRSTPLLELINPSETFGDIVIDYSYVECTSACMTALAAYDKARPGGPRSREIKKAVARGRAFVLREQRPDGSWYGSWGVCFTYAAWFGCEALAAAGDTVDSCPALRRACEFLVAKQCADGGWGESYLSCQDKVYTQLPGGASQVVNTAWAMLALLAAGWAKVDAAPLRRGAAALLRAQLPTGDWPQQHIAGVFNRNSMITYANYRNIFPMWALGEFRRQVLGEEG